MATDSCSGLSAVEEAPRKSGDVHRPLSPRPCIYHEHGSPLSCCRETALAMRAGAHNAACTRGTVVDSGRHPCSPRGPDERPPPLAEPPGLTPQPPSVFLQGPAAGADRRASVHAVLRLRRAPVRAALLRTPCRPLTPTPLQRQHLANEC